MRRVAGDGGGSESEDGEAKEVTPPTRAPECSGVEATAAVLGGLDAAGAEELLESRAGTAPFRLVLPREFSSESLKRIDALKKDEELSPSMRFDIESRNRCLAGEGAGDAGAPRTGLRDAAEAWRAMLQERLEHEEKEEEGEEEEEEEEVSGFASPPPRPLPCMPLPLTLPPTAARGAGWRRGLTRAVRGGAQGAAAEGAGGGAWAEANGPDASSSRRGGEMHLRSKRDGGAAGSPSGRSASALSPFSPGSRGGSPRARGGADGGATGAPAPARAPRRGAPPAPLRAGRPGCGCGAGRAPFAQWLKCPASFAKWLKCPASFALALRQTGRRARAGFTVKIPSPDKGGLFGAGPASPGAAAAGIEDVVEARARPGSSEPIVRSRGALYLLSFPLIFSPVPLVFFS